MKPAKFIEIPLELKLTILEYFDGDAILTLRTASSEFHRLLKHEYGLKFWNQIRRESGFSVPDTPQLPTDDELRVMLYVLNWYCQKCTFGRASHQWAWGIRLCSRCLVPNLITRNEFIVNNRELVENMPSSFNAIGWHDPLDIAGLEFSPMATKFINAGASARGHFVASRFLTEMAVREVQRFKHEEPTKSENSISRDVKGLILNARHFSTNLLHPVQEVLGDSDLEITRVGIKRENQIVAALFQMKDLKLRQYGIPDGSDPEWRSLVYKAQEMTARDWHTIKTPLVRLVKQHQVDRIAAILETYAPPTPASMAAPTSYQGPENVEGIMVGIFPASAFLKICADVDLDTIASFEKTSKIARAVLGSRAADPVWRRIRISLGLERRFDHWPERAFLAFAIRRRCFYCSQEGINIPRLPSVLCGDCFKSHVVEIDKGIENVLYKPVLRALAFVQSRPFSIFGWIETCKPNARVYSTGYPQAMSLWWKTLPADVRKYLPQELIGKHVARHTSAFIEVAKDCETWQKSRDPENTRLISRREEAILRRVDREGSALGIPGHVFQSEGWRNVADKAYPLSETEWNKIKKRVLDVTREYQVIGGVRIANLR